MSNDTNTPEYWDINTGAPLFDSDLEARYNDMLDELNVVRIGSLEYSASRVLREVDPIAYRCGYSDWLDAAIGETITDTPPPHGWGCAETDCE